MFLVEFLRALSLLRLQMDAMPSIFVQNIVSVTLMRMLNGYYMVILLPSSFLPGKPSVLEYIYNCNWAA